MKIKQKKIIFSFACFVDSVSVELQIALEAPHKDCEDADEDEIKTKDDDDDNNVDKEGEAFTTFFDMREMSMLSFSGHPEIYTVDLGSEASCPLKEHRVA